MKQKRLIFAIAAALAGSPMLVNAFNFDSAAPPNLPDPMLWAKELKRDDSGYIPLSGKTITTKVGFGFPKGESRYARIDLTGGKFSATAGAELMSCAVNSGGMVLAGATCTLRTGGIGFSYATFTVTAPAAVDIKSEDEIVFTYLSAAKEGLTVTSSAAESVKITYTLHNNAPSADSSPGSATSVPLYASGPFDYIAFEEVIKASVIPLVRPLTAEVGTGFLKFKDDKSVGSLAKVVYTVNAGVSTVSDFTVPTIVASAVLTDIVSNATLTVTGDFTAVQDVLGTAPQGTYNLATAKVFLNTTEACGGTNVGTTSSVSATQAVFSLTDTSANGAYLCFTVNGYSVINPGTFTAAMSFTPTTTHVVAGKTFDSAGRIVQNGTVLDTPYLTVNRNYISRVIFTNTSSKPVGYSAVVVTDDGATGTLGASGTGTIPANANLQINASDLVSFSDKPRGAVRFIISAPNTAVQAVYQTVNLATRDVQSVLLNRAGGGDGVVE